MSRDNIGKRKKTKKKERERKMRTYGEKLYLS